MMHLNRMAGHCSMMAIVPSHPDEGPFRYGGRAVAICDHNAATDTGFHDDSPFVSTR